MKAFHSVLGALVILASGTALASDSWYVGATGELLLMVSTAIR